jgi:LuxR family maltose regulon positive regulatory protein
MPGYAGYARDAIKQDFSLLIEAEAWDALSERLKRLFLRLSLTTHRSMGLVNILAAGDERLISELNQQNVFVHYDRFINAYRIHHLFLDFLHTKQDLLSDDEIRNTRKAIADWCVNNDFIVDALFEYEKIGDYEAIVAILFASPAKFFEDHGRQIVGIFHRAPEEIYDRVDFSAAMHIHLVLGTHQWREGLDLIRFYEAKYLPLPEHDAFKNRMLGCIYYYRAILRVVLCTEDDRYDFDTYFAKQYAYLKDFPVSPQCWYQHHPGVWSCLMGSAKATAPREYLVAAIRGSEYQQKSANGLTAGIGELCQSELLFYQGDLHAAESYAIKAIEKARECQQYEIVSRARFYIMRIAVFQGDCQKLELSLKDVERQLPCNEYSARFLTYDVVLGLYYSLVDQAEKMSDWMKGEFTPHSYVSHYENFGNYLKARYCYLTKQYDKLLAYLKKEEQRKIVLFERIELLAVKACLHLKMNDEKTAPSILQEAYQLALPNGIVSPFIELGKDMRTLINLAERCQECVIPLPWLKNIKQKASAYFRSQTLIISEYNKTHGTRGNIILSPRETVVFHNLCSGLSRSEIAAKHKLSINTVKLHISSIYSKMGARNRADMFRLAAENNIM